MVMVDITMVAADTTMEDTVTEDMVDTVMEGMVDTVMEDMDMVATIVKNLYI